MRSASVKIRSRFFSVSPTYLSTTDDSWTDVQVEAEFGGDDLRRQGLAGAGLAREQAEDASTAAAARAQPPVAEHPVAVPGAQGEFAQLRRAGRSGRTRSPPVDGGPDPAGVLFEAGGGLLAGGEPQVRGR